MCMCVYVCVRVRVRACAHVVHKQDCPCLFRGVNEYEGEGI